MIPPAPRPTLFPYTTLFRSQGRRSKLAAGDEQRAGVAIERTHDVGDALTRLSPVVRVEVIDFRRRLAVVRRRLNEANRESGVLKRGFKISIRTRHNHRL